MNTQTKKYLLFLAVVMAICYLFLAFYNATFNSALMTSDSKSVMIGIVMIYSIYGWMIIGSSEKKP